MFLQSFTEGNISYYLLYSIHRTCLIISVDLVEPIGYHSNHHYSLLLLINSLFVTNKYNQLYSSKYIFNLNDCYCQSL